MQDAALNEALSLGIRNAKSIMGGIEFESDMDTAIDYCLWSHFSTRVLLRIYEKNGLKNIDDIRKESENVPFDDYFTADDTFCVTSTIHSCLHLKSTMLLSQVVKDGVCDRQRILFKKRSYIDKENPDFIVHVHVEKEKVQWYIDFSGPSLCKRHYRVRNTPIYLQEHTSYALLYRSGYLKDLNNDNKRVLIDPFCGSGTILIEAALALINFPVGLIDKDRYNFLHFKNFDNDLYNEKVDKLLDKAKKNHEEFIKTHGSKPLLFGFDSDADAIDAACLNAKKAGVDDLIYFSCIPIEKLDFKNIDCLNDISSGYIITDPPYNDRVKVENIGAIYVSFGEFLIKNCASFNVSILTGDSELLRFIPLKTDKTNTIMNSSIKCTFASYYIKSNEEREKEEQLKAERQNDLLSLPLSSGAKMVYNRLEKNKKSLRKFLKNSGITCYRLYDADMNEYSAAVDVYEDKYIVVQEYQKGKNVDESNAVRRLGELKLALCKLYSLPMDNIYVKMRKKQKGVLQYEKISQRNENFIVHESGLKFIVNFSDYLDTGLFLDHRFIRNYIAQNAKDKRFLNLFCYTATATCYAHSGGALSSVSVDASQTYINRGKENLRINNLGKNNSYFVKSDCFQYLKHLKDNDIFDLVFFDPPTFSNSKDRRVFDVQKDHSAMINLILDHLSSDGEIIFSCNFREFKMDKAVEYFADVEDITLRSIDEDFRDKKIHKAYIIRKKELKQRSIKEIASEIKNFSMVKKSQISEN